MFLRIVLCYPATDLHKAQIAAAAPGCELVDAGQERVAVEAIEADIFGGHAKVPVDWDAVVKRGRLRWIQSSAAGLDWCLVPSVIDSPIPVCNASGLFANQVGEQTLALLLGLLRGLPTFFRQQQAKDFTRRPTGDLHGKTVGIIGLGGNGKRLAELLAPFRCRILATDWLPREAPPGVEAVYGADRLNDVLPLVDILILCVPLNGHTRGMIAAKELARMKRGAILINVARGPVVVEKDLVAALQSGHLAGAGLDVTEVEPLPQESPLWSMPNVIITPHVGAQAASRNDDATALFCDNLRRYFAGQPLRNVVDKRLGFPLA